VSQLRNDRQGRLLHPWWRDASLALAHRDAWDGEQSQVVEKRVRAVKSPEQERRANLENKIAKYRANRESQWQALGRPRPSITPLAIRSMRTHIETYKRDAPSPNTPIFPANSAKI